MSSREPQQSRSRLAVSVPSSLLSSSLRAVVMSRLTAFELVSCGNDDDVESYCSRVASELNYSATVAALSRAGSDKQLALTDCLFNYSSRSYSQLQAPIDPSATVMTGLLHLRVSSLLTKVRRQLWWGGGGGNNKK